MNSASKAADVFQEHRDELGFVNRAQCKDGDLVTIERNGQTAGAALGNHCVQKPQTTLYELAVRPAYRRKGIGTTLVDQLALESPHDKLIAKCPEGLPANEFYAATGWEQVNREAGKNRPLLVWQRQIDGVPDRITTGRPDLVSIAERYGWLRGSRLDYIKAHENRGHEIQFIDIHWEDPDREKLANATRRHEPQYVVAGDYDGANYETVNQCARHLRDHAKNVIIVPHEPGDIDHVPDWAVVGYSTPSDYAGTDIPIWEYYGHDVHILGGTVDEMIEVHAHLANDVISMDCNSFHRSATNFAKWWGGSSPHWVKLARACPQPDNANRAYENTMLNLSYQLQEKGITQ